MSLADHDFEEFIQFFFEGAAKPFRKDEVVDLSGVIAAPEVTATYYKALFQEPGILSERYAREAIDRGFASMTDCNVPMNIPELIWIPTVQLERREAVIKSIAVLYMKLFDHDPLFGTPFMWWDALTNDFASGIRRRDGSEESRRIQDAMFETLLAILALPSGGSQKAALHGLGHLQHPGTVAAIDEYLLANPGMRPDLREYARQSALGLIQ